MRNILFTILLLLLLPSIHASAFSDVKQKDTYYSSVQWALEQGVISGYQDGTFKPNETISHHQFIKMYLKAFDFESENYKTTGEYYEALAKYNIHFENVKRGNPITRGEVAVLLAYASGNIGNPNGQFGRSELTPNLIEASSQFMLDSKLSSGQVKTSSTQAKVKYGANNYLTRAQAVVFLQKLHLLGYKTLSDEAKLFYKLPTFTEQQSALRQYNINDRIVFYVMNDLESYSLVMTYNNEIVGGYEAKDGVQLQNYVIGKQSPARQTYMPFDTTDIYKINPLIDQHKNNIVHAFAWHYGTPNGIKMYEEIKNSFYTGNEQAISSVYRDLANEFRVKNGKSALNVSPILTESSLKHSIDMATRNYFEHTNLDGLDPFDRIQLAANGEYVPGGGENIAAGQTTIFAAHEGWINSLGHRENMLYDRYTHIGFGMARNTKSEYVRYFTSNFY